MLCKKHGYPCNDLQVLASPNGHLAPKDSLDNKRRDPVIYELYLEVLQHWDVDHEATKSILT